MTIRPLPQLIAPLAILLMALALGYAGYRISEYSAIGALREEGQRQLELHSRTLESEIGKYTFLPSLLELEPRVSRLLADPENGPREAVDMYLEGLNRRSHSRAIYLLDTQGRVLASSNWRDSDSYVGEDLSFRAYFQQALRGQPGRFYGVGTTTGESGYFIAHGLEEHGRIIGVAVVKVRLEPLEERWQRARLDAWVTDENGVIILSSDPTRRLKTTHPLDADTRERLARSLQYYWNALTELRVLDHEALGDGVERVTLPVDDPSHPRKHSAGYLAQTRTLDDTPWRFTLLTPLQDLRREALLHGVLAGIAFVLLAVLLVAWNERRKVLATRLAAREALQEANNLLEKRIADRTVDLRASNDRLKAQIRERRQAEQTLRTAQDQLVQAGKLAAIGQMSTSIAHELNQPLAALRTLSGNTVRFLERGALDTASTNLRTMNQLIDRMGRITASLRSFARRGDDRGQAWLKQAVDSSLQVLTTRLEAQPVTLHHQYQDVHLAIDQTRLEQILGNLVGNALDALAGEPAPQLWLQGQVHGAQYRLLVRDNGHGIAEPARAQLFEPFFTTKPGEQGLGLGLTLSASLAAAAGGSLDVEHPVEGGTAFILDLPLVNPPVNLAETP